jgi:8-oxo-dGTP pyrophosphatase MutT (NUDIX family)
MKFNNRHNELIKSVDDKEYWCSRSVAVVSLVMMKVGVIDYVLAVHRHSKSTFPNLWCMPCGFLDWDETAGEAAIRETWEETGLNLLKTKADCEVRYSGIFENDPWTTSTSPKIGSQNIIFHFASYFIANSLPELSLEYTEPDELQNVKWMTYEEAIKTEMAFGHNGRIKEFAANYNPHIA